MSTVTPYINLVKPAPLENFSRSTYNNNLDLIDTELLAGSKRSLGQRVYQESTAPSGPHVDGIVTTISSFTFKANRKYRIVWDASFVLGDATTFYYFSINTANIADTAGDITNLTVLNGRTLHRANTTITYSGPITAYYNPTADITVQIKFRATRVGGAATATVGGNAGEKATYVIYDDGAA